jgi:nicotinate phosphoribosyltransferase
MGILDKDRRDALLTDLYQLTMAGAYFASAMEQRATFELFVRTLPPNRSYLVAAGLEQALEYLENLRFHQDEVEFLRRHPNFKHMSPDFFDYLRSYRFTGEVRAMPEGTVAFAGEPLLWVSAPFIEAQVVETYLLSVLNFQTLIASKASRVVRAARGRAVVDFGTRRAHGPEAGILAARASYIGGCVGTSNVYAGYRLGIPIFGTFAHSWVMAFDDEAESFRRYYEAFPDSTTVLIDTYDTLEGARKVVDLGPGIRGVRLDSGDLLRLSKEVRAILDDAGLQDVKIVASSDLNEYRIDDLLRGGAPIDIFGVGTEMVTSKDAPALGGVYKLVEQEEDGAVRYRAKYSPAKATYPGKKQVFRKIGPSGKFEEDVIARFGERFGAQTEAHFEERTGERPVGQPGERAGEAYKPLLEKVMEGGRRCCEAPTIERTRERALRGVAMLPDGCLDLTGRGDYRVKRSEALEELLKGLEARRE